MGAIKLVNEYQKQYPRYADTPKSVIAAVALSLALRLCEDNMEEAENLLSEEWKCLYNAKIVQQVPKQ